MTVSPGVYVPTFVLAASGPMVTLTLVGLAAASDDGAPVHVPAFVAVMTPDVAAQLQAALANLPAALQALSADANAPAN